MTVTLLISNSPHCCEIPPRGEINTESSLLQNQVTVKIRNKSEVSGLQLLWWFVLYWLDCVSTPAVLVVSLFTLFIVQMGMILKLFKVCY